MAGPEKRALLKMAEHVVESIKEPRKIEQMMPEEDWRTWIGHEAGVVIKAITTQKWQEFGMIIPDEMIKSLR